MVSTERDNSGLEADIGITLGKLTRQLASAEARMVKTAKKFETDFANANKKVSRGFEQTSRRAQGSADVMGRELDRLRAKYDPIFAASKRYEASLEELNMAHKVGALNAAQYERALEALNAEYQRAAGASTAMTGGLAAMGRGSNAVRSQIQNAAFQVGDFAVQVGAGTSAAQALGQQLPQLLGGFGVMGAVLGAVVAAGVPLVRFLMDSGEEAKTLEEKLNELEAAVSAYQSAVEAAIVPTDELREKYGQATAAAQDFLNALVEVNKAEALSALAAVIDDITNKFGSFSAASVLGEADVQATQLEQTIRRVGREFDVSGGAAQKLIFAMRDLQESEGVEAQANAARDLLNVMIEVLGPIEQMEGEALELAKRLSEAGINAGEIQGQMEQAEMSVKDMIAALQPGQSMIANMRAEAAGLGDNMARAARAAWDFARARAQEVQDRQDRMAQSVGGPDRARNEVSDTFTPSGLRREDIVSRTTLSAQSGGGRSSRASGGGGGSTQEQPSLFEAGERTMENLRRQIEMIGKTQAQIAGLTTKYRLLDEAKKRNLDLDETQIGTGQTLREQIDAQAQAVENLSQKYQSAEERARFFDDMNQQLKDGLVDAIVEGENFAGVLANVAKALAKAALQAALFNEGPFSSGGGGSLLSNLFSAGVSAIGGARAMGGPVRRGVPYLVGERGPEIMVPATSGKIVPNNRIGGGGGLTVNYSPVVDARGADAAAVARLETAMRKSEAEFSTKAVAAVRSANNRTVGGRL